MAATWPAQTGAVAQAPRLAGGPSATPAVQHGPRARRPLRPWPIVLLVSRRRPVGRPGGASGPRRRGARSQNPGQSDSTSCRRTTRSPFNGQRRL
eukprot:13583526-Alexandrium_andersonii.AAC.1